MNRQVQWVDGIFWLRGGSYSKTYSTTEIAAQNFTQVRNKLLKNLLKYGKSCSKTYSNTEKAAQKLT
ncbi:hypothetical protein, partial [Lactobacillus equicursoris]|uniref:hypothetical protein n=1 Tax=Lactobacillus equicursoris TaxID=420645 RepID=UPI003993D714